MYIRRLALLLASACTYLASVESPPAVSSPALWRPPSPDLPVCIVDWDTSGQPHFHPIVNKSDYENFQPLAQYITVDRLDNDDSTTTTIPAGVILPFAIRFDDFDSNILEIMLIALPAAARIIRSKPGSGWVNIAVELVKIVSCMGFVKLKMDILTSTVLSLAIDSLMASIVTLSLLVSKISRRRALKFVMGVTIQLRQLAVFCSVSSFVVFVGVNLCPAHILYAIVLDGSLASALAYAFARSSSRVRPPRPRREKKRYKRRPKIKIR